MLSVIAQYPCPSVRPSASQSRYYPARRLPLAGPKWARLLPAPAAGPDAGQLGPDAGQLGPEPVVDRFGQVESGSGGSRRAAQQQQQQERLFRRRQEIRIAAHND